MSAACKKVSPPRELPQDHAVSSGGQYRHVPVLHMHLNLCYMGVALRGARGGVACADITAETGGHGCTWGAFWGVHEGSICCRRKMRALVMLTPIRDAPNPTPSSLAPFLMTAPERCRGVKGL